MRTRDGLPQKYPLLAATHATWLAGLWWLGFNRAIDPIYLLAFMPGSCGGRDNGVIPERPSIRFMPRPSPQITTQGSALNRTGAMPATTGHPQLRAAPAAIAATGARRPPRLRQPAANQSLRATELAAVLVFV